MLEVGDGLREPIQPPDDELLVDATAVHVLDQGGRRESAFRQVMGDAIGSGPPAHVQRDPRLHSGSVSHRFLRGLSAWLRKCDLFPPPSRQRVLKKTKFFWVKLAKVDLGLPEFSATPPKNDLPSAGVIGQVQNF
jgi:hypothetical protein